MDDFVLKHIERVPDAIASKYIKRLEEVMIRLQAKLDMIARNPDVIKVRQVGDIASVKKYIDSLLVDSGYYREVEGLLNEYQRIVTGVRGLYLGLYDQDLRFSTPSLKELKILQEMDYSSFSRLGDAAVEKLTRQVVNMQFGAMPAKTAMTEFAAIVDSSLTRYVDTWVTTSVAGYYTKSNVLICEDNDINYFKYTGPNDKITRPFCEKCIGKIKTLAQWDAMAGDPTRKGQPLPVSYYRGGYNCRHALVGVVGHKPGRK